MRDHINHRNEATMTDTATPSFAARLAALGYTFPVRQQDGEDGIGELVDANGASLLQIDPLNIREDGDVKAIADLIAEAINACAATPPEPDDDIEFCIACEEPIADGDPVYSDANGGLIHAACCGPDRKSYTGPDGEPLADGDPIPEPWIWRSDEAATAMLAELLRDDPDLDRKSAAALISEACAEAVQGGL